MTSLDGRAVKFYLPLLTILVGLFVSLGHYYFVSDVRGTDQYWYIADTETLANGLPPLTNTVFPGDVLRAGSLQSETYFAHNGPLLHINGFLARFISSVAAWKYTNLFFFLGASVFTGMTISRLSRPTWGYIGAITFLLTPINVWLTANFLQEIFYCFLSAAIFFVAVTDNGAVYKRIGLLIALLIGTMSHPLFLIVGVCFALYKAVANQAWLFSAMVIGVVSIATGLKSSWFPTSFPPSIQDLISASIPNVSNSIWQLSDQVTAINSSLMIDKLLHALSMQFVPTLDSPLYLVTNLGLVSLLILLIKHRHISRIFLFMSVVFMLSYGSMIVLMQNQVRYQLFITPISIACCSLWMCTWSSKKIQSVLLLTVLSIYLFIDTRLWGKIQEDVKFDHRYIAAFKESTTYISPDDRVLLLGNMLGGWLPVVYALRPSSAMPVFRNLLSDDSFYRVFDLYRPDYIIVSEGMSVAGLPEIEFVGTIEFSGVKSLDVYSRLNEK